jgi:hypothetical protein
MYFYINILISYRISSCFTYDDTDKVEKISLSLWFTSEEYAIVFTYSVFSSKLYKEYMCII